MLQQFCCELLLPASGGLLLEPEDPQRQLQYLKGREQVAHVSATVAAPTSAVLLLLLLQGCRWRCWHSCVSSNLCCYCSGSTDAAGVAATLGAFRFFLLLHYLCCCCCCCRVFPQHLLLQCVEPFDYCPMMRVSFL